MITNNFNKELRGISDALRDLGYTDSTIGLRQRYWKEYCFFHGSLGIDESSMDELRMLFVIPKQCTCSVWMLIFITFETFLDMCRLKRLRFTPVRMRR